MSVGLSVKIIHSMCKLAVYDVDFTCNVHSQDLPPKKHWFDL